MDEKLIGKQPFHFWPGSYIEWVFSPLPLVLTVWNPGSVSRYIWALHTQPCPARQLSFDHKHQLKGSVIKLAPSLNLWRCFTLPIQYSTFITHSLTSFDIGRRPPPQRAKYDFDNISQLKGLIVLVLEGPSTPYAMFTIPEAIPDPPPFPGTTWMICFGRVQLDVLCWQSITETRLVIWGRVGQGNPVVLS